MFRDRDKIYGFLGMGDVHMKPSESSPIQFSATVTRSQGRAASEGCT